MTHRCWFEVGALNMRCSVGTGTKLKTIKESRGTIYQRFSRGRSVEAQTNRVMMAEDRRLSGTMKWFEVNLSTGPPYTWGKAVDFAINSIQLLCAGRTIREHLTTTTRRQLLQIDVTFPSPGRCTWVFSRSESGQGGRTNQKAERSVVTNLQSATLAAMNPGRTLLSRSGHLLRRRTKGS